MAVCLIILHLLTGQPVWVSARDIVLIEPAIAELNGVKAGSIIIVHDTYRAVREMPQVVADRAAKAGCS